jgi:hypothetical protein
MSIANSGFEPPEPVAVRRLKCALSEACKPAAGPSASELQALVSELYGGNKPLHVVDNFILERREQAQRE